MREASRVKLSWVILGILFFILGIFVFFICALSTRDAHAQQSGYPIYVRGNPAYPVFLGSGADGGSLKEYSYEGSISTNGTTTVTSSTAYVKSLSYVVVGAGLGSTFTVEDGGGQVLVNGVVTTAIGTTPTVISLDLVKFSSGIKIVSAGTSAATVNVWMDYFQ